MVLCKYMKKLIDCCDWCYGYTGKLIKKVEGLFHDDNIRRCYHDFKIISNEKSTN